MRKKERKRRVNWSERELRRLFVWLLTTEMYNLKKKEKKLKRGQFVYNDDDEEEEKKGTTTHTQEREGQQSKDTHTPNVNI